MPTDKNVLLRQWLDQHAPHFIKVRHQIHANPELAFQENLTAALVAHELKKMDVNFKTHVGGMGIIALIDSGKPGKTVALRADMDALPLTEMTELPYDSSENPPAAIRVGVRKQSGYR